jgi:photosystem II stability/assembly factor-like uncharacterized protein
MKEFFSKLGFIVVTLGIACSGDSPAPAKNEWKKLSSGTSEVILGVSFVNENLGYAVGTKGLFLVTEDGGNAWRTVSSGVTKFLRDVYFLGSIGIIVGESGLILKTDGTTFTPQVSGTTEHLVNVHFINDQIGIAVGQGGVILKTNNGGASWTKQQSGTTVELTCVKMLDENTAVVVGFGGKILRTIDGGGTWNPVLVSGLTSDLRSVAFLSANGVTVGMNGKIARSSDAGQSWSVVTSNTATNLFVTEFDGESVYAAGGGKILLSSDAGATWSAASSDEFSVDIYGMAFVGNNGWATGQSGLILHKE